MSIIGSNDTKPEILAGSWWLEKINRKDHLDSENLRNLKNGAERS